MIVVVQVGAVKIYVATVEALTKEERQDETGQSEHDDSTSWPFCP
jgi:hypothetical protein